MASTFFVQQRTGETWNELTGKFMEFCIQIKGVTRGGCHEGDSNPAELDGQVYASVAIPDHSPDLMTYLTEWASSEDRQIWSKEQFAEQGVNLNT
tara:strand:- start:1469 stop:1753 length:285 start_codon:yes stop_codon:yes gene_type:complete